MLLRFGVSNIRSIRSYAELSLVPSTAIKDIGPDLLTWSKDGDQVLPVIMIYGANASGKSALYASVGMMKRHVTESFSRRQATDGIDRPYFALDETASEEPSRIDCDFVIDNVRYHYGFEFDDNQYLSEWLYYMPEGHRRVLFTRDNMQVDFGKSLRGQNKAVSDILRQNSLFLSTAAQVAHAQLTPIYEFFAKSIFGLNAGFDDFGTQRQLGRDTSDKVTAFLRNADTGIRNLRIEPVESDILDKPRYKDVTDNSDEQIDAVRKSSRKIPTKVQFSHAGKDGKDYYLDFITESRGTRRLASIMDRVFRVLDSGAVLFIDEIDASLHTVISTKVIELFSSNKTNPNRAQLIAVTHDTNLLCQKIIRRDQVWFAEKSDVGDTIIYPLTDIKTRNTDNLEKGYLQGRFGAIPFIGDIDSVVRDAAHE
jgi:hypothetical protein